MTDGLDGNWLVIGHEPTGEKVILDQVGSEAVARACIVAFRRGGMEYADFGVEFIPDEPSSGRKRDVITMDNKASQDYREEVYRIIREAGPAARYEDVLPVLEAAGAGSYPPGSFARMQNTIFAAEKPKNPSATKMTSVSPANHAGDPVAVLTGFLAAVKAVGGLDKARAIMDAVEGIA